MAKKFSFTPLVLVVLTAAVLLEGASAAIYVVGDATGWLVPPSASFYSTWAANKTFVIGDILVFNFITGQHDVARVNESSFGSCNINNPISLQNNAPVNYTLNATGNYYFICTFGQSQHCLNGQKLNVNVTSNSGPTASPPSSPPPSPTPSAPPTATPPPAASPAPGSSPAQSPSGTTPPPPPGTTSPPTPPAASPPGSPPAGTTPPPPPPPPPSSSPPKAVAAFSFAFMSIVIGIMF